MNMISRVAAVVSVSFSLGAGVTAYCSTLEGVVKDSHGQALSGAQIRVAATNGSSVRLTTTNGRGHYVQSDLAGGTYHVSLLVNGETKAMITNVAPKQNETETLNFSLTRSGVAQPSAAGRHYVLMKAPTGTHIDRWVEADSRSQMSVGMQERMGATANTWVRQVQSSADFVRR
jgi:hypothetical protein